MANWTDLVHCIYTVFRVENVVERQDLHKTVRSNLESLKLRERDEYDGHAWRFEL